MSDEGYPPTPPRRYSDYNHNGDNFWQTSEGTFLIPLDVMDQMPLANSVQQQNWWSTQKDRLNDAVANGTVDEFVMTDDGLHT